LKPDVPDETPVVTQDEVPTAPPAAPPARDGLDIPKFLRRTPRPEAADV
jgi:hypothetical protein